MDASHQTMCVIQENDNPVHANLKAYDRSWFVHFVPIGKNGL